MAKRPAAAPPSSAKRQRTASQRGGKAKQQALAPEEEEESSSSSEDESDEDEHDDECAKCTDAGNLLVCSRCVQAYHFRCLPPSDADDAEDLDDEWSCKDAGFKCTRRKKPKKLDDEEVVAEKEQSKPRWTSKALSTRAGNTYYSAVSIYGESFNLGDTVVLENGGQSGSVWLAEILQMWEDQYKELWMENRWFYFPEETMYGRLPRHGAREVFETAHVDENPLTSIDMMAHIITKEEFDQNEHGHPQEQTYYCRERYNDDTGEYRPRIGSKDKAHSTPAPSFRIKKAGKDATPAPGAAAGQAIPGQQKGVFHEACSRLMLSSRPTKLPCREAERSQIHHFLKMAIQRGGRANGLYISGMPGTGKTATVMQCVRELEQDHKAGKLPKFDFVEINGMKLPEPAHAYTAIYKALTGKHASPGRAAMLLEQRFKTASSKRSCCVLLVDELDYIMNKKQDVIYNLFDWPGRRYARLVVVGIANTMDLPERLMPRVCSRLGLTRLTFAPYTRLQLEKIVKARLQGLKVFDADAIELCGRKVASVSGDVRRALQICRRAAEIGQAEHRKSKKEAEEKQSMSGGEVSGKKGKKKVGSEEDDIPVIGMKQIEGAIQDLFDSNFVEALRSCCTHEKLFIKSLMMLNEKTKVQEVGFADVAEVHMRHARNLGLRPLPSMWDLKDMVGRMKDVRLITAQTKKGDRDPIVRLQVQADDVNFALRDDDLWSSI